MRSSAPALADGPFPEHYEALECPIEENLISKQRINPTIKLFGEKEDAYFSCDVRYPFVATTYRVSEHWQTGVMTRHLPWQLEMQPQMFLELSEELAKEKSINDGDKVIVIVGPRRALGRCRGNEPAEAVQNRRLHRPPGRHALALRLAVSRGRQRRRQRQPAHADRGRRKYHDPRDKGLYGQCPSR